MVSRVMGSLGLEWGDSILTLIEPSIARGKWLKQFEPQILRSGG
jgi:hypothetical protein